MKRATPTSAGRGGAARPPDPRNYYLNESTSILSVLEKAAQARQALQARHERLGVYSVGPSRDALTSTGGPRASSRASSYHDDLGGPADIVSTAMRYPVVQSAMLEQRQPSRRYTSALQDSYAVPFTPPTSAPPKVRLAGAAQGQPLIVCVTTLQAYLSACRWSLVSCLNFIAFSLAQGVNLADALNAASTGRFASAREPIVVPRAPLSTTQPPPVSQDAGPLPPAAVSNREELGERLAACCAVVTDCADVLARVVEESTSSGRDKVRARKAEQLVVT